MKKRIISLLLCLVMLMGALPLGSFTVFAKGDSLKPITKVAIKGYSIPKIGQSTSIGSVTVTSDPAKACVDWVTYWWNDTDNTGSDKTFQEGKQYYLVVELHPLDGYYFEWDDTWQQNYTGTAKFLGTEAQVAWSTTSEYASTTGTELHLRSQLYTPIELEEADPIPVVNKTDKTVTLSDGTVIR